MHGPDKAQYTNQGAYEAAVERYTSMDPEKQLDYDSAQRRGGCLIQALQGRELDSGSPVNCDNGDCGAFRPNNKSLDVDGAEACLVPVERDPYLNLDY